MWVLNTNTCLVLGMLMLMVKLIRGCVSPLEASTNSKFTSQNSVNDVLQLTCQELPFLSVMLGELSSLPFRI